VTPSRAVELATRLRPSRALVVEDDHAGDIARSPLVSLGSHLPDRTVLISSFSKSHGPDLRLAAVGGAGDPIRALTARRLLGVGWSSRLLQQVLLAMLQDRETIECVETARETYAARRDALVDALSARGVATTGRDGINLWVTVADELSAQLELAANGIGVAPGRPFTVSPAAGHHLRITSGLVRDGVEQVADLIGHAAAARPNWGRGT
jgi:DNA-binding transcriptional MocR family regulator